MSEDEARALLASLPRESRNISRRKKAAVIDRLRAAVEALLRQHPPCPVCGANPTSADGLERAGDGVVRSAELGNELP